MLSKKEQRTRHYYDKTPFIKGGDSRSSWWKKKNAQYLIDSDIKNKNILDVGCSHGEVTKSLLERGAKVTGVDLSLESLKNFDHHENLDRVNASVLDLPFQDQFFDHSQAIGVLHHTPNPKKGFEELVRVTKDEGKIFIFLYRKFSLYHWLFLIIRPLTWIIPLPFVPIGLLSWLGHVTRLEQGYRIDKQQLRNLLGDSFWTPVVSFHTDSEMRTWANEYGLEITKKEDYFLKSAFLYLFVKKSSSKRSVIVEKKHIEEFVLEDGIKKYL